MPANTRGQEQEMEESLARIQVSLTSLTVDIRQLGEYFTSLGTVEGSRPDAYDIRPRQLLLEAKYTTYEQTLVLLYTTTGRVEPPDSHNEIQGIYFSSIAAADRQLARLITPTPTPDVNTPSLPLPKITLPSFDGNIEEWPAFIALFDAIVHNNTSLGPSQRFHYLRTSLTGQAASIVSGFTLNDCNYKLAYDALRKRYQNDRRLAHIYLNRILGYMASRVPSLDNLRSFETVHRNAIEGLKALPIDDLADFLLMSLTLHNLDSSSRQRFENTLPSDAVPTLEQLLKFVSQQVRVFENSNASCTPPPIERPPARGLSPASRPSAPLRLQRRDSLDRRSAPSYPLVCTSLPLTQSASPGVRICLYCRNDHSIYRCQQFRNTSVPERRQFVTSKGFCLNCLGTQHQVAQCPSDVCCLHCGMRHHTLLHPTNNNSTQHRAVRTNSMPDLATSSSFRPSQRSRSPSFDRTSNSAPNRSPSDLSTSPYAHQSRASSSSLHSSPSSQQ